MGAPTLISYTETTWNTALMTKSTASISWQTGDVVAVIIGAESSFTPGVPTATGLTFVTQKSNGAANTCGSLLSAAVAVSNGSGAVSSTFANGSDHWGMAVWVWRGSQGIGNSAEQHTTTDTVALTPKAAHCAVVWGSFDFAAGASPAATPTPTNSRQALQDGTHYSVVVADLDDQSSSGAVSYGDSDTGGPFSIVVLEIQAGSSGASFIPEEDGFTTATQVPAIDMNVSLW